MSTPPTDRTDRHRRVDAVFDAAMDLPTAERLAFLDRECGDDDALRAEVLDLLVAYTSSSFLESPAVRLAAPLLAEIRGAAPTVHDVQAGAPTPGELPTDGDQIARPLE